MIPASRKWLITALVLGGVSLFAAIATFLFQSYRIGKINFIIMDNQRDNVAGLSSEEFIGYVQECGGSLDSSSAPWTARYDGVFQHKEWKFFFNTPQAPPSR